MSGVGVASGLIATIWWCAYQRPGLELPGMVKLLIASALVVLAAAEEAAAQDAAGSSNFVPRKRRPLRCMLCERVGRGGPLL